MSSKSVLKPPRKVSRPLQTKILRTPLVTAKRMYVCNIFLDTLSHVGSGIFRQYQNCNKCQRDNWDVVLLSTHGPRVVRSEQQASRPVVVVVVLIANSGRQSPKLGIVFRQRKSGGIKNSCPNFSLSSLFHFCFVSLEYENGWKKSSVKKRVSFLRKLSRQLLLKKYHVRVDYIATTLRTM